MAKLKPADQKFVDEVLQISKEEQKSEVKVIRRNRFGGRDIPVSKVVAKCIDFAYEMQELINTRDLQAIQAKYPTIKSLGGAVQKFDRARYLVLAVDSQAYSEILN